MMMDWAFSLSLHSSRSSCICEGLKFWSLSSRSLTRFSLVKLYCRRCHKATTCTHLSVLKDSCMPTARLKCWSLRTLFILELGQRDLSQNLILIFFVRIITRGAYPIRIQMLLPWVDGGMIWTLAPGGLALCTLSARLFLHLKLSLHSTLECKV